MPQDYQNRCCVSSELLPYFEYQFLCGFAHFSPPTMILSALLDRRRPDVDMFTSGQVQEIFQKEIAGPALWLDLLSVVQSCCEISSIYPGDVELARVLIEASPMAFEQSDPDWLI